MNDLVRKAKKILSNLILWLTLAVIAVLAIPTGMLILVIAGVCSLSDKVTRLLEQK